jgi:hypothetical protein
MSHERQTVSYEFFNNGEWTYDHKEKLKELRKIVEKGTIANSINRD